MYLPQSPPFFYIPMIASLNLSSIHTFSIIQKSGWNDIIWCCRRNGSAPVPLAQTQVQGLICHHSQLPYYMLHQPLPKPKHLLSIKNKRLDSPAKIKNMPPSYIFISWRHILPLLLLPFPFCRIIPETHPRAFQRTWRKKRKRKPQKHWVSGVCKCFLNLERSSLWERLMKWKCLILGIYPSSCCLPAAYGRKLRTTVHNWWQLYICFFQYLSSLQTVIIWYICTFMIFKISNYLLLKV